ncbi:MAG: type I 3-dehydroquinate dehydratase [Anaerolineae bacterium]|nr:type I 3-dehydroquinate dehydratase [Anaerolineae bacterium]MDW8100013.1 type I 3-dehydroquinate dehydratase [Anaerolineae bacterium]
MPKPLIAVALGVADTDEARRALERVAQIADLAEIRLDLMRSYDLPRLLRDRPCPVIITHRPRREGGRFDGDERQRVRPLLDAISLGAEHVDIEWDSIHLLAGTDRGRTRIIVSRHDFERTPEDLPHQYQALAAGGDVVKLVGMARRVTDLRPVIQVLRTADRPTIAIGMGEAGLASRVLALRYPSCYLTYAALEDGAVTAPGQVTLRDLREIYHAHEINANTVAFGHLTPVLPPREMLLAGNAALRTLRANAVWVPLIASSVDRTVLSTLDALELAGCSVDATLAERVALQLPYLTPKANRMGRVDTLVRTADGRWIGDYWGMDVLARAARWAEGVFEKL